MHKQSTRELAVALRKKGYSYPYISAKTGLSKSTLSGWLTEIPYTPNAETVQILGKARAAAGKRRAQIRQEELSVIRKEAFKEVGKLSKRDIFLFGLGLYLGEGTKTHGTVCVVNSDPKIIRLMVIWFRALGIEMNQIAPRLHAYPDTDVEKSIKYWSSASGIPAKQFQKTYIDIRSDKKKKMTGKLPFGTLYIAIRSKGRKEHGIALLRKILAWNEVVLEAIKMRD